jgi:hypothetical protein
MTTMGCFISLCSDDALDEPSHLIGAAARAGRNDEFHGFRRLPGRKRLNRCGRSRGEQRKRHGLAPGTIGKVAHFSSSSYRNTPSWNAPPSAPDASILCARGLFRGELSLQFSVTTLTEVKPASGVQVFSPRPASPLAPAIEGRSAELVDSQETGLSD